MTTKMTAPLPHWENKACRDDDRDVFFMDEDETRDQPNPQAAAICSRCLITNECLQWALDTKQRYGVWGGTTPRQRTKLLRVVVRVSCPGCFGTTILEEPTSETCLGCGLTWQI